MSAIKSKAKKPIPAEQQLTITFGVKEVKSIEFALTEEGRNIASGHKIQDYEYRFDVASSIHDKLCVMNVLLTTTILLKQGEKIRTELAHLKTLVSFNLFNLPEITTKHDNQQSVPELLYLLTYGITVSSARGMLAVHLEGTKLTSAVIPIIDPKILVAKMENVKL